MKKQEKQMMRLRQEQKRECDEECEGDALPAWGKASSHCGKRNKMRDDKTNVITNEKRERERERKKERDKDRDRMEKEESEREVMRENER